MKRRFKFEIYYFDKSDNLLTLTETCTTRPCTLEEYQVILKKRLKETKQDCKSMKCYFGYKEIARAK